MPAINRYISPRIEKTMKLAETQNADFLILSGKFGLLRPLDPIPWYDHMLTPDEVSAMAQKIAPQLSRYTEITFFHHQGDYIAPYLAAVKQAAGERKIHLSPID